MDDAMSLEAVVPTILKRMKHKRYGHGSSEAASTNGTSSQPDHPSEGDDLESQNSHRDGKRKVTRLSMVVHYARSASLDIIGVHEPRLATLLDVDQCMRDLNKLGYSFTGAK